ncbi:Septum-associated rare lipoprotein A [hydrothermal vent metagenome]|uniref:Septum-associated rare lipoprotein A n=1 Tax=hydrothermal vent metagenome TaxID=652676 RepID=A0A3B0V716_9ZZZZ
MTRRSLAIRLVLSLALACMVAACTPTLPFRAGIPAGTGRGTQRPYMINNQAYYPINSAAGYRQTGIASWYGRQFQGKRTANGEIFNMYAATAAHKTLPMNTMLLVRNLENGRETTVRINDRGPFAKNRIIDLSYAAARRLDMLGKGTARVRIIALGRASSPAARRSSRRPGVLRLRHKDFYRGWFYVQVGAFSNRRNAERLAHRFADGGARVVIRVNGTRGTRYYRVLISAGRYLNAAKSFARQLNGRGYPGAFVVGGRGY